jgi:AcrR family transcriptional regulator
MTRTPSAATAAPQASALADAEAGLGLRERKKLRTRQAIQQVAYRLIETMGYENTTIEQIAAAAEVSPSTVFRYFPTKEDIVLRSDYAVATVELLRARPADEPPLAALREALTGMMRLFHEDYSAEYTWKMALVREVPAVRAQMHAAQDRAVEQLTVALAERTGRRPDELELRVVVGAFMGGLHQAVLDWGSHGQQGDLPERVERALTVLERGLTL